MSDIRHISSPEHRAALIRLAFDELKRLRFYWVWVYLKCAWNLRVK